MLSLAPSAVTLNSWDTCSMFSINWLTVPDSKSRRFCSVLLTEVSRVLSVWAMLSEISVRFCTDSSSKDFRAVSTEDPTSSIFNASSAEYSCWSFCESSLRSETSFFSEVLNSEWADAMISRASTAWLERSPLKVASSPFDRLRNWFVISSKRWWNSSLMASVCCSIRFSCSEIEVAISFWIRSACELISDTLLDILLSRRSLNPS